jgi:monoterpene epsilon-lactone hydrolase
MSDQYEALVSAMLEKSMFAAEDPTEVARDRLNAVHGHPISDDVLVEWIEPGGIRAARVTTPESLGSTRTLFLCHGGAYIAAGGDGYLFYAVMLSRACRSAVVLVDYRLAPEHLYPAALEDCANAYQGLLADGLAAGRVVFIGDSCGGALAVTSLLWLRDRDVAMPAAAIALGGWFDLEANGDSARNPVGPDPFANRAFLRARGRDYVGPSGDLSIPWPTLGAFWNHTRLAGWVENRCGNEWKGRG